MGRRMNSSVIRLGDRRDGVEAGGDELAVEHALGADHAIGQPADLADLTFEGDHLETVALVDVDMHRGDHVVAVVVLEAGEAVGQRPGAVVVDDGDCGHRRDILGELHLDEVISKEVPDGLGAIGDASILEQAIEPLQEMLVDRDADSDYVPHGEAGVYARNHRCGRLPGIAAEPSAARCGPKAEVVDMDWSTIPSKVAEILERFRFDESAFDQLVAKLARGELGPGANRITGDLRPPPPGCWTELPPVGSAERRDLEEVGRTAISEGKVGAVVLNGGMATRFGGTVKGAVEALEGRSFLQLKVGEVRGSSQDKAPVFLMNSFATDAASRELVRQLELDEAVTHFTQGVMLRVTPAGEIARIDGEPSPYAPGHGDLADALTSSAVLESFIAGGGELLQMSNVDNLGATLDPAVIGAHLRSGGEMTVELVAKDPGDKGGAPAELDGKVQIIEDFRFPEGFDQDAIPVFNTNTFVFDAAALQRRFPLTWFAVQKKVGDQPVVQFERLAGELTAFLDARYLLVPRSGPEARFLPVKDPDELQRRRPAIEAALRARGVLE